MDKWWKGSLSLAVPVFDYLRFYVPLKKFSLIWRRNQGTAKVTCSFVLLDKIDGLIIYGFTSRSRIFHLYGDVIVVGEGLQNLGLCSVLRPFEQGGIFIVPHLL